MEAISPSKHRVLFGSLGCVGVAVAWTVVTLFFGGTNAHAAEDSEGLLSELTSTTTSTVTKVADGVTEVADAAVEAVAPVAKKTLSSASATDSKAMEPVRDAATAVSSETSAVSEISSTVSEKVDDAVGDVVAPVTQSLDENPLATFATPLVGSLERVPVIGEAVTALSPSLTFGIQKIDSILGMLDEIVPWTPDPIAPVDDSHQSTDSATSRLVGSAAGHQDAVLLLPGGTKVSSLPTSFASKFSSASGTPPTGPLGPGAPPLPDSSIPASNAISGGSAGTAVCVSETSSLPTLELEDISGAQDDALPPSPVFGTDVSPD